MPNQSIPLRFAVLADAFARLTGRTMSSAPLAAADKAFADLAEDDYDAIAQQVAAIAESALLYLDEAGYQTGAGLTEVEAIQSDVGRVRSRRG